MVEVLWRALRRLIWFYLRLTRRWPLEIGLDLDGVVDETFFARFESWIRDNVDTPVAKALTGTGHSMPGGRVGPTLGITPEAGDELFPRFLASPTGFAYAPSIKTKRSLRRLWFFGRLHVVTRRDIGFHLEVLDLLASTYGDLISSGDVHWSFGDHMRKGLVCDAFQLDVLVDDQPDYIDNCTRQFGILFGGYQWTYADKEQVLARPNVFRALTWSEVLIWRQRRQIWKAGKNLRNWIEHPAPPSPYKAPICSHEAGASCPCHW